MSLWGGIAEKEETNIVNNPISERAEGADTGPLFQIRFLEGGCRGICGGALAGGVRFRMLSVDECNTASHTRARGSGEYLPVGKEGKWLVMDNSSP